MSFFKSKFFVGLVCFVVGVCTGWLWSFKNNIHVNWSTSRHSDMGRDLFLPGSIFENLHQFQSEMAESMTGSMTGGFAEPEIVETDSEYVVEVPIQKSMKANNFSVQIERGQLLITGTLVGTDDQSSISSTFSQSFPAPPNIDSNGIQVENQSGKVVIRLPKK